MLAVESYFVISLLTTNKFLKPEVTDFAHLGKWKQVMNIDILSHFELLPPGKKQQYHSFRINYYYILSLIVAFFGQLPLCKNMDHSPFNGNLCSYCD